MQVNFYEQVDHRLLHFAVIVARHRGKGVFCKHRQRRRFPSAPVCALGDWEKPGQPVGEREGENL